MQCQKCGYQFSDEEIIKEAAAAMGRRGRGPAKARDAKKMSRAGKKGGWPKGRKRLKKAEIT